MATSSEEKDATEQKNDEEKPSSKADSDDDAPAKMPDMKDPNWFLPKWLQVRSKSRS